MKNIETIFIPGDDDDDFPKPLNTGMKAKFLGEENNTRYSSPKTMNLSGPNDVKTIDDSSPQQPFMSNYVRGVKAKEKHLLSCIATKHLHIKYYLFHFVTCIYFSLKPIKSPQWRLESCHSPIITLLVGLPRSRKLRSNHILGMLQNSNTLKALHWET